MSLEDFAERREATDGFAYYLCPGLVVGCLRRRWGVVLRRCADGFEGFNLGEPWPHHLSPPILAHAKHLRP